MSKEKFEIEYETRKLIKLLGWLAFWAIILTGGCEYIVDVCI